jgi:hypothetical protein
VDHWLRRRELAKRNVSDFEEERLAAVKTATDQVLHHLCLTINGDRTTVCQLIKGYAVALAGKLDFEAAVYQAFCLHSAGGADVSEYTDRVQIELSRAKTTFDIIAAAKLEHH